MADVSRSHIRYQFRFPGAIPKLRAGCSRVTHPFAARVPRRAFPLDLHVLSTPPAFVLSQDQTLQQKPLWKIYPDKFQRNCRRKTPTIKDGGHYLALAYPNTLLSSQETNAHRNSTPISRAALPGQLPYFTRSVSQCQPWFLRIIIASLGPHQATAAPWCVNVGLGESP